MFVVLFVFVFRKYLGVIQQLYIGKFQCRACGLRFTSKQKNAYNHHLDWHFWENKQAKAAAARFQSSRDWYPLLEEWMIYEEDLDEKIRNNQLLAKQNRHGKDNDQKEFSSHSLTDETSCPAKSNGDIDDDVSRMNSIKRKMFLILFRCSVVSFVMIHLKISSTIIEKNGD